jgi:hypothetical protein
LTKEQYAASLERGNKKERMAFQKLSRKDKR